MSHYKCIDCFSGAGGLCLGLINAGFDILYSFDIDPNSIDTIKANPKYFKEHHAEVRDINNIDVAQLLASLNIKSGQLDLLAGGPPCQGFSIQRIGNDIDDRNQLVEEYIGMVVAILPRMFILENVPGIKGKRGKNILNNALERVEKSGYYIHEKLLDAQDYGVPQRRKRVVIVGERKDHQVPLFEFPEPQKERVTVRDAIGSLPAPPSNGSDHPEISLHRCDRLSEKNIDRLMHLKPGQGRDYLPPELLAECHKLGSEKIGHRNVYGRMSWDDVAPTITARFDSFTRGMFGHPEQNRSISLREGALLQTFPVDFVFCGNKVEVARQIGNAVPVKMAKVIGDQVVKCLEQWNN